MRTPSASATGHSRGLAHDLIRAHALFHQVLGDHADERRLAVDHRGQHPDTGPQLCPQQVRQVLQLVHVGRFGPGAHHTNAVHLHSGLQPLLHLVLAAAQSGLAQAFLQLAPLFQKRRHAVHKLLATTVHQVLQRVQPLLVFHDHLVGHQAGDSLNPPHASRHRGLGYDVEVADLAGGANVCTTAKLAGVVVHFHNPHLVAVLLAEESHCAAAFGFVERHDFPVHGVVGHDRLVHHPLDGFQLLRLHFFEMVEVEPQVPRVHKRTRLLGVLAENRAKGLVQQVCRRVVAFRGPALLRVDSGQDRPADQSRQLLFCGTLDKMQVAVTGLLRVDNAVLAAVGDQDARVAHLAAAFRVERGLVQNHLVAQNGQDFGLGFVLRVTHETRRRDVGADFRSGFGRSRLKGGRFLRALPLLVHQTVETLFVDGQPSLAGHQLGQVQRETVRVVQEEGHVAGENLFTRREESRRFLLENLEPAVQSATETLLFGLDHPLDQVLALPDLRVEVAHHVRHRLHQPEDERLVHVQDAPEAGCASQDAPQHVAPTLVGRQGAVGNGEREGADVVGQHPKGHIRLREPAFVRLAGDLFDPPDDRLKEIGVVVTGFALQHSHQPLQSGPGVHVFGWQLV